VGEAQPLAHISAYRVRRGFAARTRAAWQLRTLAAALTAIAVLTLQGCAPTSDSPPAAHAPTAATVQPKNAEPIPVHVSQVVHGGSVVSGFGRRTHPMGGGRGHHDGIDIASPQGAPVYAAASGQIVEIGRRGPYGRLVRVRHANHLETAYAHLSRFPRQLKVGQQVNQGDVIGYVGTTGRSSGPHLHYEVRRNGKPVDPLRVAALQ
jgi:murein DD-endopeptidase MepM/ murein hydrolase activator NlpD